MKLTLDLENLENNLQNQLAAIIDKAIVEMVKDRVVDNADAYIEECIHARVETKINSIVDDFIDNHQIQVGGGLTSESKLLSVDEYMRSVIAEKLNKEVFKEKDRYGNYQSINFTEYIKNKFNYDQLIQIELDQFITKLRSEINQKASDMFSQSTKQLLSEAVLNILKDNATYQSIVGSVKQIAGN